MRNATFPVLRVDTHTLSIRTRVASACNATNASADELPTGGAPIWKERALPFLAQQEAYDLTWADYTVDVEAPSVSKYWFEERTRHVIVAGIVYAETRDTTRADKSRVCLDVADCGAGAKCEAYGETRACTWGRSAPPKGFGLFKRVGRQGKCLKPARASHWLDLLLPAGSQDCPARHYHYQSRSGYQFCDCAFHCD
jgi:hypothetical protein